MNRSITRIAAASLVALAAGSASAQGDDRAAAAQAAEQRSQDAARAADAIRANREAAARKLGPVVTVEFKGGTLADYLAAIRGAISPAPLNVVTSDAAKRSPLAPISLANVPLDTALRAVESASESDRVSWSIRPLDAPTLPEGAAPTWSIQLSPLTRGTRQFDPDMIPRLEVMSIQDITTPIPSVPGDEAMTPQTVLSAIEAALRTMEAPGQRETEPATIRFHAESGVLFVNGTAAQTKAVRDVLERLMENRQRLLGMRREASSMDTYARMKLQSDAMVAAQNVAIAKQRLESAVRLLLMARQRREAGAATEEEVVTAQEKLAERENELRVAEIQAQTLQAGLRELPVPAGSVVRLMVETSSEEGKKTLRLVQVLNDLVADPARLKVEPADGGAVVSGDARILSLLRAVAPMQEVQPQPAPQPGRSDPARGRGGPGGR